MFNYGRTAGDRQLRQPPQSGNEQLISQLYRAAFPGRKITNGPRRRSRTNPSGSIGNAPGPTPCVARWSCHNRRNHAGTAPLAPLTKRLCLGEVAFLSKQDVHRQSQDRHRQLRPQRFNTVLNISATAGPREEMGHNDKLSRKRARRPYLHGATAMSQYLLHADVSARIALLWEVIKDRRDGNRRVRHNWCCFSILCCGIVGHDWVRGRGRNGPQQGTSATYSRAGRPERSTALST